MARGRIYLIYVQVMLRLLETRYWVRRALSAARSQSGGGDTAVRLYCRPRLQHTAPTYKVTLKCPCPVCRLCHHLPPSQLLPGVTADLQALCSRVCLMMSCVLKRCVRVCGAREGWESLSVSPAGRQLDTCTCPLLLSTRTRGQNLVTSLTPAPGARTCS